MIKRITLCSIMLCIFCIKTKAGITLKAATIEGKSGVTLQWNMLDYAGNTGYTLFKSSDGIIWQPAAANHVYRTYTSATILAYTDKFTGEQKLFYKVKVYDENENIVAISNTEEVANPERNYTIKKSSPIINEVKRLPGKGYSTWQIYPNPVGDILNLYYKGTNTVRGVINAVIQDATGKAVKKFRAASNNKHLSIDVSNLHAGFYFIRINVFDEVQMNEKFIKQ